MIELSDEFWGSGDPAKVAQAFLQMSDSIQASSSIGQQWEDNLDPMKQCVHDLNFEVVFAIFPHILELARNSNQADRIVLLSELAA